MASSLPDSKGSRWLHLLLCVGIVMLTGLSMQASLNSTASMRDMENAILQTISYHPTQGRTLHKDMDYQAAITALRCFVTPGCFPSQQCRNGEPQKIPRNRPWEERGMCVHDIPKKGCIAYSFGIDGSTEFEETLAKIGCEVHAFDPTKSSPSTDGVKFHPWGLQGVGTDVSTAQSELYEAKDKDKLFTLSEIMEKLGHEKLDILMMDCEGCEWGVLREMACSGDSARVDQLLIEVHLQKNLGLANDEDVLIAGEAVACLERERWNMASIELSGCDPRDAEYVGEVAKVTPGEFSLIYVALQRTLPGEPMQWELLRNSSDAYRLATANDHEMKVKYNTDKKQEWSKEDQEANAALSREKMKHFMARRAKLVERAKYDEPPRVKVSDLLKHRQQSN